MRPLRASSMICSIGTSDGRVVVRGEEPLQLAEGVGGRVPALLGTIAQGVGMKAGGARKSGARHAAFADQVAHVVDGGVCS